MNKFPFIMIIVAGLFSCNNNHSSCPIITADFTTDSLIDTNLVLEAPVLPKEYREYFVSEITNHSQNKNIRKKFLSYIFDAVLNMNDKNYLNYFPKTLLEKSTNLKKILNQLYDNIRNGNMKSKFNVLNGEINSFLSQIF